MYYQPRTSQYNLRQCGKEATRENVYSPQRSLYDSVSTGHGGHFAVCDSTPQNSDRRLPHFDNGGTRVAECPMTSFPMTSHSDDVIAEASHAPAPSPYDCKPPYSYISLIAMAIESSPDRRLVYYLIIVICRGVYIQECNLVYAIAYFMLNYDSLYSLAYPEGSYGGLNPH